MPPTTAAEPHWKGHSEGWDGGTWNHGVHPGIQHCLPAAQPRPQHFCQRGISPAWAGGCWQAGRLPAPWGTQLCPRGVNSPAGGDGSPFPFRPRGASVAPRRENSLGTQGPSGRGCPGCTRSGCPGLPGAGVSRGLLLPASRRGPSPIPSEGRGAMGWVRASRQGAAELRGSRSGQVAGSSGERRPEPRGGSGCRPQPRVQAEMVPRGLEGGDSGHRTGLGGGWRGARSLGPLPAPVPRRHLPGNSQAGPGHPETRSPAPAAPGTPGPPAPRPPGTPGSPPPEAPGPLWLPRPGRTGTAGLSRTPGCNRDPPAVPGCQNRQDPQEHRESQRPVAPIPPGPDSPPPGGPGPPGPRRGSPGS